MINPAKVSVHPLQPYQMHFSYYILHYPLLCCVLCQHRISTDLQHVYCGRVARSVMHLVLTINCCCFCFCCCFYLVVVYRAWFQCCCFYLVVVYMAWLRSNWTSHTGHSSCELQCSQRRCSLKDTVYIKHVLTSISNTGFCNQNVSIQITHKGFCYLHGDRRQRITRILEGFQFVTKSS